MGRMKLLSNVINNATNQVEGFCLVKSVQLKVNVKGAEYLDFTLADADGEVNAKLWDYQTATHGSYSAGEIIKVRGTINMFRDTEQLKIDRIRKMKETDEVDLSSIVAEAPIDGELDDATKKIESEAISYYQGAAMLYEKGLLKDPATK